MFSDIKELFIETKGEIEITCHHLLKKVLVQPWNDKSYEIKFSEKPISNFSIEKDITKFDYEGRTYYISSKKEITSSDKVFQRLFLEETQFYKPKE